jgi:hypothetical protein
VSHELLRHHGCLFGPEKQTTRRIVKVYEVISIWRASAANKFPFLEVESHGGMQSKPFRHDTEVFIAFPPPCDSFLPEISSAFVYDYFSDGGKNFIEVNKCFADGFRFMKMFSSLRRVVKCQKNKQKILASRSDRHRKLSLWP